jgi:glyoxylase-like metal-dependent hydrolase (beta-lactamase superfamily II)
MSSSAKPLPAAITHLTAPNPGPFTGDGTNTYIVGTDALAVIDPGPDDPAHLRAILAAARGRPITHILLTHAHIDHVEGLSALQSATGAITIAIPRTRGDMPSPLANTPSGTEFIDRMFRPDVALRDGLMFHAGDHLFETLHTPGHAPDHVCFAMPDYPEILFSGDHVMGWSTSVIAPPEGHMGDYFRALERVSLRPEKLYLPGHGPLIADGARTARVFLLHRQARENSVLQAVRDGATTIPDITAIVYAGIADNLLKAARLSTQAHLEFLAEKGAITAEAPFRPHTP